MSEARNPVKSLESVQSLSTLRVGESGCITFLSDGLSFRGRLQDLGFVPGSRVRVRRRSPLRDPIEYEIRNTRICLRRSESEHIFVCDVRSVNGPVSIPVAHNGDSDGPPA